MSPPVCPAPDVLAAFDRGALPADSAEPIAAHVESCAACQAALGALTQKLDTLLACLRQVRPAAAPPGYVLLGELGRGGMGVVHRAHDTRLQRAVAVKLLREDYPADSAAAERFRAEAQITGQLQHPGVPAVHELGSTADGRPFLAMKLIKGRTLQELLAGRAEPGLERGRFVAIFEQVCQAVGYAHAHRVIHRDLKPGNVMVGAFGEVQVMDWGLAKVLTGESAPAADAGDLPRTVIARTAVDAPGGAATRTGTVMGTPAYMAPEQASGEVRKLDARSDVFGLGAILCQILTGQPPYGTGSANEVHLQAMRGDPRDALARLDTCAAEPDLVALCKRCLAFRPEDRPADGEAVAQEVARIRQAAEERARQAELERAAALVREAEQRRRRRLVVGAASAVAVVLLIGITGTTIGLFEANRANEQAQTRLAQVEKGNEILLSIFTDLNVRNIKKGPEPLEAVLAPRLVAAARQLEGEAVGEPLHVAELQDRLGLSVLNLGEARAATALFDKAFATRTRLLGADDARTLDSLNNLATGYHRAGQLAEALPRYEEALRRRRAVLGADHPDTLTTLSNIAVAYRAAGDLGRAAPFAKEAVALTTARLGADHPNTLTMINNLAATYHAGGQFERAVALLEEVRPRMKARLGADHPDTLACLGNLATAYEATSRPGPAVPLLEEVLAVERTTRGADHPDTLTSLNNLASACQAAGLLDRAVPLYEEALKRRRARLGPDHPDTRATLNNLATAYMDAGQLKQALPMLEELVGQQKAALGDDHPATLMSMNNLATACRGAGQLDRAVSLYEEALHLQQGRLGADHPSTLTTQSNLAQAYEATGQRARALPLHEDTVQRMKAALGPGHPDTLTGLNNLAAAYLLDRQVDRALPLLEELLLQRSAKLGADHPGTLTSMNNLAVAYKTAGQLAKALPIYEEALRLQRAKLGDDHPDTLLTLYNLALACRDAGQLDRAVALHDEALRRRQATLGADHPATLSSLGNLALAYCDARRAEKAVPLVEAYFAQLRKGAKPDDPAFAAQLANVTQKLLACACYREAEPYLRECLAIRTKLQPDAWSTFNTQAMLGAALLGQKQLAQAEPLLLQGYAGMRQREATIPAAAKVRLKEALERLVELYTALDRPAEAARWQKELAGRKD
jgi:tRNA A-37 threonylcarbamoyl transferase component Bud32